MAEQTNNYQGVLRSPTDKIQIVSVTGRINDTIAEPFDSYDERAQPIIEAARQALIDRKLLLYFEGPLGIGKGTLARRVCRLLRIPFALEDPEAPEVKKNLQKLYDPNVEIKKVGAVGVNVAYLGQRTLHEEIAARAATSYGLDRRVEFDQVYMDEFVEGNPQLMTAEDRDRILHWGAKEMALLTQSGFTAPKRAIIQMVGSSELVYRRKNRRARDVEVETSEGRGVPFAYIDAICKRYLKSPEILANRGFEGLLVEVGQELANGQEFVPENERHLLSIVEVLTAYARATGPSIDLTDFKRT